MTTYLPPTEDLPNFNPSVFQNGSTEGITIGDADVRYVKKSGSIMTGSLSTPSLLVNSIDVETQLDKISSLETKTTEITHSGSTTTISNTLDITGLLTIPNVGDVEDAIDTLETKTTNISHTGTTTTISNNLDITGLLTIPNVGDVEDSIQRLETKTVDIGFTGVTQTTTIANNLDITGTLSTPNVNDVDDAIDTLQTNTVDITHNDGTAMTSIANNLNVNGVISTPSITNLQTSILANDAKFGILGSVYVSWNSNSTDTNNWGADSRLDSLTTNYQKNGTISVSENTTRDGAVDVEAGTYRIKVHATVVPRQTGSITISSDRIHFLLYLSINNGTLSAIDLPSPSAAGYTRQLNNNNQGYGTCLSFEKLYYFSDTTTELSIKTQTYSSNERNYTGTFPNNNFNVYCTMIVERVSESDTQSYVSW